MLTAERTKTLHAPLETSNLALFELRTGADNGRLLLEKRNAPIEDRITVSCLTKTKEGALLDVETGIPLAEMIAEATSVDKAEKSANQILELKVGDSGITVVWISGPSRLRSKESRYNFFVTYTGSDIDRLLPLVEKILVNKEEGIQRIKNHGNIVLLYASPSKDDADKCVNTAKQIIAAANISSLQIDNLEQLRTLPLSIEVSNKDWAEYFSKFINLPPKVWERFANNSIFDMQSLANKDGVILAHVFAPLLWHARGDVRTTREIYRQMEMAARKMGYDLIEANLSCPTNIFDLFNSLANRIFGLGVEGKKVKNCGNCGAPLNKYMSKGDKCPYCQGTYEGC